VLFKDIIGQESVKQQLVDMVKQNRISHALLFLGKEGSGALPLAITFAQYISLLPQNIHQPSDENSLFGSDTQKLKLPDSAEEADAWMQKQIAFQKANQLVHPDIHFTFPVITKKAGSPPLSSDYISEWREFYKQFPYGNVFDWLQFIGAENKQGNITAQECNEIIKKLSLKSFESGYKILILWMPEYLGKEGNKLLKIIEEPPPNTVFLLIAENEKAIISTILSRCQLVKIPAIERNALEAALITRTKSSPEKAKEVAHLANGNYREALNILQHSNEDYYSLLKDWLNAILKDQTVVLVKQIEEISRLGRENQKQFLRYFNHLIEQAVNYRILSENNLNYSEQLPEREKEFIPRINRIMTIDQQNSLIHELDQSAYYIERNANAKILFHALSIKIFHIVKNNVLVHN
jgi:DNA polymerase III, gamma/tau subunits